MSEGDAPPVLVVDNNVAVKWYVPQDFGEEALRAFHAGQEGEASLVAPDLILAEFGNALWRYHQHDELSLEEIQEFWEDFGQAPISVFDMAPLVPKALEVATHCGCTVYDALYLSLAEAQREEVSEGAVTLTADGRLLRRLEGTPYEDLGAHISNVNDFLPVQ